VEPVSAEATLNAMAGLVEADRVQVHLATVIIGERNAGWPVVENDAVAALEQHVQRLAG
jgi:hypothetical protein